MKIFDCFMYFDEEVVLDVRLNTLDKYVDYFVIVESSFTHKGDNKNLMFNHNKFEKFKNKIIYLVYDKQPKGIEVVNENDSEGEKSRKYILNAVLRENGQRNFIQNGLNKAEDNDIILISDVDEIPNLENINFSKKCKKNSINFVQLISPTTSKYRMKRIINDSHDMIYYISMLSTTGGKLKVSPSEILKNYNRIKKINKSKNLVIGFGITDKTISSLKKADGLVVGSALCKEISESIKKKQNPVTKVGNMVKRLRTKLS